jgi:hypothetical protein
MFPMVEFNGLQDNYEVGERIYQVVSNSEVLYA